MQVKLSICIPTYNRAKFLSELLDSIINQLDDITRDKVEIVISDNSSEDNTSEVVSEYKKRFNNIVYFKWEKNMGADRNYLKVVELARGDYCWLMGSDDVILDGIVSKIFNDLCDADIMLGERINTNLNLVPYEYEKFANIKEKEILDFSDKDEIIYYLEKVNNLGGIFSYISAIIFKKQKWDKILDYEKFIGTAYVHSYILISILKSGGKLKYLNYPIVINRGENDSFLDNGYLNRVLIDFEGYFKFSEMFDDILIKKLILKILKGTYPFYRIIKVFYYIRKEKQGIDRWIEMLTRVKYSKDSLKIYYYLSFLFPILIYSKKNFYFILKKILYKFYEK